MPGPQLSSGAPARDEAPTARFDRPPVPDMVAACVLVGCTACAVQVVGWPGVLLFPVGVGFLRRGAPWRWPGGAVWLLWVGLGIAAGLLVGITALADEPFRDGARRRLSSGDVNLALCAALLLADQVTPDHRGPPARIERFATAFVGWAVGGLCVLAAALAYYAWSSQ